MSYVSIILIDIFNLLLLMALSLALASKIPIDILLIYLQVQVHIEVNLPNLRHPQLSIKEEVLILKDGIFFANIQTILPTCFIFTKP